MERTTDRLNDLLEALEGCGGCGPEQMLAKAVVAQGLRDCAGRSTGLSGRRPNGSSRLRAVRAEFQLRVYGGDWLGLAGIDPRLCDIEELVSVAWDERVCRYGPEAWFVSSVAV